MIRCTFVSQSTFQRIKQSRQSIYLSVPTLGGFALSIYVNYIILEILNYFLPNLYSIQIPPDYP